MPGRGPKRPRQLAVEHAIHVSILKLHFRILKAYLVTPGGQAARVRRRDSPAVPPRSEVALEGAIENGGEEGVQLAIR